MSVFPCSIVMAGFSPAIHDLNTRSRVVDTRPKGGHDGLPPGLLSRAHVREADHG